MSLQCVSYLHAKEKEIKYDIGGIAIKKNISPIEHLLRVNFHNTKTVISPCDHIHDLNFEFLSLSAKSILMTPYNIV